MKIKRMAVVLLVAMHLCMTVLTGCSFKIETGYHGLTGRDDRTQTSLVKYPNVKKNVND